MNKAVPFADDQSCFIQWVHKCFSGKILFEVHRVLKMFFKCRNVLKTNMVNDTYERTESMMMRKKSHSKKVTVFTTRVSTTRWNPTVGGPLVGFLFENPHFPRGYRVGSTSNSPTRYFAEWVNKSTFFVERLYDSV